VIGFYGLASAGAGGAAPRVSIVRPREGNVADFRSGHMVAATRTQFLDSELVADILQDGAHRLVPIRDHEALARALPGTRPGFIPAGLYGPERREPAAPVPTITVRQLLVARNDVPGRVVTDLLHVVYDPRFARDLRAQLTEASGRDVAGLALHPAADVFYRRNDLLTSDRLGRISFVASSLAALAAGVQFALRFRRRERRGRTREAVAGAADRLLSLREELQAAAVADLDRALQEVDTVLCGVEREAAAGGIEPDAIAALRSLHAACHRAAERRRTRDGEPAPTPTAAPPAPAVARGHDGRPPSTGGAHADGAVGHPDRAGAAG
jgi:hypothetical protein